MHDNSNNDSDLTNQKLITEGDNEETSNKKITNKKNILALAEKKLIKGPYILGDIIGEGTFGKVRLATQIKIGEKLAIKIINKKKIVKNSDIIRVKKEISILKKIRHKNIIQIYEVMESAQNIYIVMEYCEGNELFDYIIKNKKLSELESCRLFRQLINGIDYIHNQGIIHRDLKPENLLLDSNLDIKISDFGLSTFFIKGKFLNTPCGTPNYAPPEMLSGQPYNGELTDIWSCGVILYTMLTGTLPCSESKESIILNKIMTHQYKIPKFLSLEVIDLLNLMLEPNYKKRIKIIDIMKHPWFNIMTNELTPGIDIKNNEYTPIDENILKQMIPYGFDIQECRDNLQRMKNNSLTTVYYLLLKKFIQNGGESIADLKSNTFLEYMKFRNSVKSNDSNLNISIQQNSKITSEESKIKKKDFVNKNIFDNGLCNKIIKHAKKKSQDNNSNSLQLKKYNFKKGITISNKTGKNIGSKKNNNYFFNNIDKSMNSYLYNKCSYIPNNKTNVASNTHYNFNTNNSINKRTFNVNKKGNKNTSINTIINYKNNITTENSKKNNFINKNKIQKKPYINPKKYIDGIKNIKSPISEYQNISQKNHIIHEDISSISTIHNNIHYNNLAGSMTIQNKNLNIFPSNSNSIHSKSINCKGFKQKTPKPRSAIKSTIIKKEINELYNIENDDLKFEEDLNKVDIINPDINVNIIQFIAKKLIGNSLINNDCDEFSNKPLVFQTNSSEEFKEIIKDNYVSSPVIFEKEKDNNKNSTDRFLTDIQRKKNMDKSVSQINYSNEIIINSVRNIKKMRSNKDIIQNITNNVSLNSSKNNNIKNNNINYSNSSNKYNTTNNSNNLTNKKQINTNSKIIKNKKNQNKTSNNSINNTNKNPIRNNSKKRTLMTKDIQIVIDNNNKSSNSENNESVIAEVEGSEAESKESKTLANQKLINSNTFLLQNKNNDGKISSKPKIIIPETISNRNTNNLKNIHNNNVNTTTNMNKIKISTIFKEKIKQKKILEKNNVLFFKSKEKQNKKKFEIYSNRLPKKNKNNKLNNQSNKNIIINKKNKSSSNNQKNTNNTTNNTTIKQTTKFSQTRSESGSEKINNSAKMKPIILNKNRRKQKEQLLEVNLTDDNNFHMKHLTSGNISNEKSKKPKTKRLNTNDQSLENNSVIQNQTINSIIEKINEFMKKEKYGIEKNKNPNIYLFKYFEQGGVVFQIEVVPLTFKNSDTFYLKKILIKGDKNKYKKLMEDLLKYLN